MKKKKDFPELTRPEFNILQILWNEGRLSVRELHDQLKNITGWAYSTTKTMMDRMVGKNLLKREKFHGLFLYSHNISRPVGLVKMIRYFADHVLNTDISSIVSLFVKDKSISPDEIEELKRLLEE